MYHTDSRTHPAHTWKRKSRHWGSDRVSAQVWTHGGPRMPAFFHQGLGDMLMGQAGVVSVTVMGRRGALHEGGAAVGL